MQAMPCALVLDLAKAGNSSPARIAMIAITTSSSIKVNPLLRVWLEPMPQLYCGLAMFIGSLWSVEYYRVSTLPCYHQLTHSSTPIIPGALVQARGGVKRPYRKHVMPRRSHRGIIRRWHLHLHHWRARRKTAFGVRPRLDEIIYGRADFDFGKKA